MWETTTTTNNNLFEYCFHLNSETVHPDIVHGNRKRALLLQSTVREEYVEKKCQVIAIIGCLLILVQVHPPQYRKPGSLYKYLLV